VKMRSYLFAILFLTFAAPAEAEPQVETLVEGLDHPWSLAFLPDGSMLVTERGGTLRIVRDGHLLEEPVAGVPEVLVAGQGGLFDVVLDPQFEANQTLYLSYAHGEVKANATRVMRATFDGTALTNQQVIFTASPLKGTPHHYGGRMAFFPDGTLLLTTGEGFNYREDAQRLSSELGKLIRITTDGATPDDNPFADANGGKLKIWTYGHRNPQAIVVVPDSGEVYLNEHGPRGGDELNVIQPGLNYGWPVISHGIDYPGSRISPYTEYPNMEQALVYWVPSIAPAGMSYYDGDEFPEWKGDLFVAALAERSIRRLDLENGAVLDQEILFADLGYRMRDVRTGPDGALYLLTDSAEGKLLRVTSE
jgi:glucose/arabinose dehydrogenase